MRSGLASLPRTLLLMDVDAALAYSRKHGSAALLVERAGERVAEVYDSGTPSTAHPLYSGTKSFWGVTALHAQSEGLLDLDKPVAETFDAWKAEAWKRRVTPRMLLQLTAGYGFGGLGASVPPYPKALAMDLKNEPGTTFAYGGIQLQVFGALLARELEPLSMTPHQYLAARILEPAGVRVASWRTLSDGTHPLPTGASLTAEDWLAYGRYVLRERKRYAECFRGSEANARYGLGWWLGVAGAPADLFYASGAGGQGMYAVPSLDTLVVRFGKSNSYKHDAFVKRLLLNVSS